MFESFARLFALVFGPNARRTAAKAARARSKALADISTATKNLRDTKVEALSDIRAAASNITCVAGQEEARLDRREEVTGAQVGAIRTAGDNTLKTLTKVMVAAQTDTTNAVSALRGQQAADDAATEARITDATAQREVLQSTVSTLTDGK